MATSNPHTQGVESGDSIVTRQEIDTLTPGSALVTAVFAGAGLIESHTGVDLGTGDVTISLPQQPQVSGQTFNEVIIDAFGRVVGGTLGTSAALSDTGVTAGTYGSQSQIPVFVVDVKGRLSHVSNVAIAINTSQVSNLGAWAGSDSITTLGTVVSGVWNGSIVDVAHGGTGRGSWTPYSVLFADSATSIVGAAPNTTTAVQFLSMQGTGVDGAAPIWKQIGHSDISDISTWPGSSAITTVGTVTQGTWHGTAVGAVYGGTGRTSYAVGDLLCAATTTSLSVIADVAAGYVLLSGGVNALPLYGKVSLSTHVSGVLGSQNGGTGASNAPASGQVLVGRADGTYAPATVGGDANIAASAGSGTLSITHKVSGITAGVYGSATNIPVLTLDVSGHVTNVSTVDIDVSGVPTLNQPVNQIAVGNGADGLTSFSGFTYDNTTGVMRIGSCFHGPNQWLAATPGNAFAIGLSMAAGEWAFGQNSSNTYMNAKPGHFNVFMVDGTIKGWCGENTWNLFTLSSDTMNVTSGFKLDYLSTTPGVLVVDSAGAVAAVQISDSKVAYDAGDTPGYLPVKLQAGAGITMTTVVSGTGKTMVINSRTNSWRPVSYAVVLTHIVIDTDDTIVVNSASIPSTNVVLPLPGAAYAGRVVTVQNAAASGTTTITSSGTIAGASPVISTAYGKLEFQCLNNGTAFVWVCR